MNVLTRRILDDCKPSLGVTEPGAIALAVAAARERTKGEVREIHLALNSGMYKNAFTCGIPGTQEVGFLWAAALGAVAGKAEKGLEALEKIDEAAVEPAKALLDAMLCALAFAFSRFGFGTLIGVFYPICGYLGIPFVAMLFFNWKRAKKEAKA